MTPELIGLVCGLPALAFAAGYMLGWMQRGLFESAWGERAKGKGRDELVLKALESNRALVDRMGSSFDNLCYGAAWLMKGRAQDTLAAKPPVDHGADTDPANEPPPAGATTMSDRDILAAARARPDRSGFEDLLGRRGGGDEL